MLLHDMKRNDIDLESLRMQTKQMNRILCRELNCSHRTNRKNVISEHEIFFLTTIECYKWLCSIYSPWEIVDPYWNQAREHKLWCLIKCSFLAVKKAKWQNFWYFDSIHLLFSPFLLQSIWWISCSFKRICI